MKELIGILMLIGFPALTVGILAILDTISPVTSGFHSGGKR